MRVAVRPPEYFPRFAYLALLASVDVFVLADTFAYSRQSFQNRCRIRTPGGVAWVTVPLVSGAVGTPVREVVIAPEPRWRDVHVKTLRHHLSSAPFAEAILPEAEALIRAPAASLADLTTETVRWSARTLGAPAEVVRASTLPDAPASLPDVLAAVGATELWTLPESGETDRAQAHGARVGCRVLPLAEPERRQNFPGFEPDCSALDLLAVHGPEAALRLAEALSRLEVSE